MPPLANPSNDWSAAAAEWSAAASFHLRQDRLDESMAAYTAALDYYGRCASANGGSLLAVINQASCWRNVGAIHRKRREYVQTVESWKRAETLYRRGRERLLAQKSCTAASQEQEQEEMVSLEAYLVETLQTRAALHTQLRHDPREAIDCHEQVVDVLLDREAADWCVTITEAAGTAVFGPMAPQLQSHHLVLSLEALGSLYTATGAYEDGLAALEEALQLLRARCDAEPSNSDSLIPAMSRTLQAIADLYLEKLDTPAAAAALQDALDLQLAANQQPPTALLDDMDAMGRQFEQEEDYEQAMTCYEKTLLIRNRFLGDKHVHVAKSLINVARVMELQGNDEGSLDIYRAAQAIYTRQVTSSEFKVASEDIPSLLRLIPNVMEQGRYEEAVAYLTKCLESNKDELDKTQIYFDLGQAYIGMGDYVSATVCLVECAKQDGAVSDEQIGQLLDHVEFLKQEQQAAVVRCHVSSDSDNGGDSDDDNDEDEDEDDDARSQSENRSHSSQTERSHVPHSSETSDREEISGVVTFPNQHFFPGENAPKYIKASDDKAKRGSSSSSFKGRDQANTTPITAEFSRTASNKSDQASVDDGGGYSWTGDDDEYDAELLQTPNRRAPDTAPSTPSELSLHSVFSGASPVQSPPRYSARSPAPSPVPSPVVSPDASLSPAEPQTEESERQSITDSAGPFDEDNEEVIPHSISLIEWQEPEIILTQSADTRALLEESDVEDEPAQQQIPKSRSLSLSISSPRRKRDNRRKMESKSSDSVKEKKNLFRRRRRQGFESLPEDKKSRAPSPLPAVEEPLERDKEYHLDESSFVDAPVRIIEVEPGWDDVSEISFNPHGSAATKKSNEWWWGVTAEGFGRWFPSSIVSQAVEAADGFLSAKAIHSRVKSAPLHVSEDESTVERESQPTEEYASHLGVAGKRQNATPNGSTVASRDEPIDVGSGNLGAMMGSSPGRRRKKQDILSDIRECSQQIAQQRMKLDETDPALGETLFRLALLHGQNQNIAAALEAATSALRIQKLNSNFVAVARTVHFIAGLQLQERQYKSALSYYSEALRLETNLYGKYSEECAKTLNSIGTVRSLQNEFKLAMDSHKEALHVLKECHGEDLQGNPLLSQTLCQIGAVYYRERNALSSIKSKTGDYTTFIEAGMLEIIGRAHEERGSYKMAIAFFEEKLQFLENASSSEEAQDELATTLNSLGMLSSRAGLFMEAVDYYERALNLQMKIESDIVYMSTAKVLTATVQFQLGFWHKSLQLLREALPVLEEELGDTHETVAATYYHIGVTQAALCDYDAAMASFSDAYAVQERLLGKSHPATLRTRREIGNLYAVYKSELDFSFEIFTEVLTAQQRIHGTKHPNIAETLHSIGCAYALKGADSTALKTLEECYYMRLEFLGVDHPLQATTLHEIAKIHMKKGRARKATSICDTVLEIRKESLSEWHIDYARALATKGSSLSMRGEFEEATSCLDEALRVAKQSVFATHPAIAEIQLDKGLLWLRKCQFTEAKKSVELAADLFRKANFDEDHPDLLRAADLLDRIERDEGLYV